MRIAVPYDHGDIFPHFGHTESFKLYEAEDGRIVSARVVSAEGFGHGALVGFLKAQGVDALICGGIGGGAWMALTDAGITAYGGVTGSADEAAEALAAGRLVFDPDARCAHHEHSGGEHSCADHNGNGCGEHRCH